MILAFPASGTDLNADIDQRFGRCPYFVSYDTETKNVASVSNAQNYQAAQGAGIQSATHVVNMKADVCITTHCGPKAFQVFEVAGVKVVIGVSGKISDAIERFEKGELKYAASPNVEGHWI
ncbi:MAG: NifB/NifX family molybdenum-iron cluster-binding protein [Candidatus Neomarinimicrobiota bacterium]|jgi:predicted Fe-Mo cluster-binding NifX family protein